MPATQPATANPLGVTLRSLTPQELGLTDWSQISTLNLDPTKSQELSTLLGKIDAAKSSGAKLQMQQGAKQFRQYWAQQIAANPFTPAAPTTMPPPAPPQAPADPNVQQALTTIPQQAPAPAAPAPNQSSILQPMTEGIDITKKLEEIFNYGKEDIERLRSMQMKSIEEGLGDGPAMNAEYQAVIDNATKAAQMASSEAIKAGEKRLSGLGVLRSSRLVDMRTAEKDHLTQQILGINVDVGLKALDAKNRRKSEAYQNAEAFVAAIEARNAPLAQALLEARKIDQQAVLDDRQMALTEAISAHTMKLERDQFTSDDIARMKELGMTQQQIDDARDQMLWQRTFNESQQRASFEVANRNLDIQEEMEGRRLTIEDFRAYTERIRNNDDVALNTRVFELQRELGLGELAQKDRALTLEEKRLIQEGKKTEAEIRASDAATTLNRDNLELLATKLEREYNIEINRLALERSIQTGKLDLDILNSQRQFDLAVESERNSWLKSQAALDLQRTLGLGELELRQALGEGELELKAEAIALEKWMFKEGLSWDRERFFIELKEAKKKKKGGLLGGLIKGLVGGAVGFITGGPVGAIAGAASASGILSPDQSSAIQSFIRPSGGTAGPINNTPATTSALGDWTAPSEQYT